MLKSRKFRKITGLWLKMLVWLVILVGVVLVQSGAFRPVEVEASINISATLNEPIIEKVLPATGPVAGNTGVTITGENFEAVNAVTFGGVNALSFRVESPTLITALTPPGKAGAVKVAVVTADKAISLDNGFTYVAPPTATAAPSPTVTASPTNPAPTATVTTDVTTPAATTPATTEITGSPEAASPGPATTNPAAAPSPSPEATTPESSPAVTVEPTGSPAVSPGPVTTGPASTPAPTAAPSTSPTTTATTPAVTVTNTPPSPTVSPTSALTPTSTVVPTSSPTATIIATTPAETPATVSVTPAVTPTATSSVSPTETVSPAASISPTQTITATASVSPAATGTPDTPTTVTPGTPVTEGTPTATVVVTPPTPTAIVAPTATPAASPSPSPTPVVSDPPTISQVSPATGPATGGTAVIIKGTNFTEDTQVTFGGLNPASVIINGPTQLTVVTAPQPAGKISIVVKTGFGLALLADGFTYTAQTVEISQAPTNFNYSGKLTGKVLTLKSTFSVGVKDLSESGIGWHLVARSTVLSSGNDVIPVANHTIQNVRVVTKSGTPAQNKVAYPLIFPTSDHTIFSAEPNTGTGEAIITFETQLVIPPDIPAGNYKLTLNVSVEPGA